MYLTPYQLTGNSLSTKMCVPRRVLGMLSAINFKSVEADLQERAQSIPDGGCWVSSRLLPYPRYCHSIYLF